MDGYVVIGTELDTKGFDKQIKEVEYQLQQIDYELSHKKELKLDSRTISEYEAKAQKLGNQLERLRQKQAKLNSVGFEKAKSSVDAIGKSVEDVTRKIGRWALAIFGIRSAYMYIRQSMSTLSEYNDELATKLANIKLVLATSLEPIINRIISLVVTLLSYLNYITKILFGIDLFARARELTTNKIAKDMASGAKSAKEMKKQLAGFDEMNVLSDNTSNAGGGGGGGAKTPEFNLPEVEIPKWFTDLVDFIKTNGDIVIAVILGIAAALWLLKAGISPLMALGIGVAIAGLVYAIEGLLKYLKEPTWENFGQIIQGIGIFVLGLGIAFLGLPGIIAGVVIVIWGTIVKYWKQIEDFLKKGIDWLTGKSDFVRKTFGDAIGDLYDNFIKNLQKMLNMLSTFMNGIKYRFDQLIKFVKNVFAGDWKKAWENVKNIFKSIWDSIKTIVSTALSVSISLVWNSVSTIGRLIGDVLKAAINSILSMIESKLNAPIDAINALIGAVNKLPGVHFGKLSRFKLPRLAKGGIINQPGRGVPVGGAIGGERGQEGVIPLTDSQQMALLGEAIGKYITINATIPVYAYNRQVDRQMKKIQASKEFAMNG